MVFARSLYYADLIIPELPEIACVQREDGVSILERVHLYQDTTNYYPYSDIHPVDKYFFPINLDTLTLQINQVGFCIFEITYLNK